MSNAIRYTLYAIRCDHLGYDLLTLNVFSGDLQKLPSGEAALRRPLMRTQKAKAAELPP